MRVFVTGGTGLVGTRLIRRLRLRGDAVVILTRRPDVARDAFGGDCTVVEGDPMQAGAWMDALRECDAVAHLAGENIFGRRWNADFKALLHDSRVRSTENVVSALLKDPRSSTGAPKVLVSASAIGYYGSHGDEELTEESAAGSDALASICIDWEKAARPAEAGGVRFVIVRVGVVLDREGGALRKMLPPFRFFVGGPVGSGRQHMSWIHHADMTGLLLFALDTGAVQGPLNATAPQPVTNREFSRALGRALHRPSFMRTPRFMLRLMLGEVANVITTGQRVLPAKALARGYRFQFSDIASALIDIFSQ
jgi:uncharacterized protein (TIGR01777 family)